MSIQSKGNKENFRLLDLSSDEESEDLQLEIIPSRKKKVTRRERSRAPSSHTPEVNIADELKCAVRWAMRGTLVLWLFMLTWICAALYDQVCTMRIDISHVSTSSEGVGDALQMCHSAVKVLRANATEFNERLTRLESEHRELAKLVEEATNGLARVSGQLSAAPKLADTPRRLAELQRTVADFGSQINGFDGALNSARHQAVTAVSSVEEVRNLVRQLDTRTNETFANLTANVTANVKRDEELKNSITSLNTTLVSDVDTLRTRIEELMKPVSTAAPTSSTAAAAAAPPNATVAPTQPPDVPVKPIVVQ